MASAAQVPSDEPCPAHGGHPPSYGSSSFQGLGEAGALSLRSGDNRWARIEEKKKTSPPRGGASSARKSQSSSGIELAIRTGCIGSELPMTAELSSNERLEIRRDSRTRETAAGIHRRTSSPQTCRSGFEKPIIHRDSTAKCQTSSPAGNSEHELRAPRAPSHDRLLEQEEYDTPPARKKRVPKPR